MYYLSIQLDEDHFNIVIIIFISKAQYMSQVDPCWHDVDIVKKYHKYPEFKKELDDIQKTYKDLLNMSLYANLNKSEQYKVFQVHPVNQKASYLYIHFYGCRMPASEDEGKKLQLLWIRNMDQLLRQNPKKKYIVLYYHTLAQSSYPFAFINTLYKKLPLRYYAQLQMICIIEANLMVKSVGLLDFGRRHKIFSRRLQFIESYSELSQLPWAKKDNVMISIPKFNSSSIQQNSVMKEVQRNKLMPLIKKDCLTIELNEHKTTSDGLPLMLQVLLELMRKHPEFIKLQGIFRKNGNIEQQQEIIQKLKTINDLKYEELEKLNCTGYSYACIIKKFFTKLTVPLIPYDVYNKILATNAIKPEQQVAFIIDILSDLPKQNRRVFLHVTSFLKQHVIPQQSENKMNNYNMSVVFCPCFFRSEKLLLEDLMSSGKFAGILNVYFNRYEQIQSIVAEGKIEKGPIKTNSRGSRGSRNLKENVSGRDS